MPYKNPEDKKECARRRYERQKNDSNFKERKKREAAARYKRNKQDPNFLTWKQKLIKDGKDKPCDSCGVYNDWRCNDFHHKDPNIKEFTISNSEARKTKEEYRLEMSKCYVLCCLCHRKIHANLLEMIPNERS
jgi:hypothetical protein